MSFNPSVGILWVQASRNDTISHKGRGFQSLSRDSMGSGFILVPYHEWAVFVSIPQSGFYGFRRMRAQAGSCPSASFNPSVGILWVQA